MYLFLLDCMWNVYNLHGFRGGSVNFRIRSLCVWKNCPNFVCMVCTRPQNFKCFYSLNGFDAKYMRRAKSYFYKCVFNDMAHALILRKDVDEDWLGMTWQKCKWKMRKNRIHSPCGFWYGKLCQKGNGSDSSAVHKYANNLIDSSKTVEICR